MSIITNPSPPRRRPETTTARPLTEARWQRRAARKVAPEQAEGDTADVVSIAPVAAPVSGTPTTVARHRHLRGTYVRVVKPTFDRCLAIGVLAVMAVPMIAVALAVRITMGGPVLFRQERVGLNGQPFTVLKFRTMHADRRREAVPVDVDRRVTHKSVDDPRHTPVGRFLRKWSLDELPQLVNVARGEMSIIGPRPELVAVVRTYDDPSLHDRHLVRPGLTGLWQVSARGDGLMHENPEWDLEYIRTVSLRTDLKILAKTPIAMLSGNTGE